MSPFSVFGKNKKIVHKKSHIAHLTHSDIKYITDRISELERTVKKNVIEMDEIRLRNKKELMDIRNLIKDDITDLKNAIKNLSGSSERLDAIEKRLQELEKKPEKKKKPNPRPRTIVSKVKASKPKKISRKLKPKEPDKLEKPEELTPTDISLIHLLRDNPRQTRRQLADLAVERKICSRSVAIKKLGRFMKDKDFYFNKAGIVTEGLERPAVDIGTL